jgi:hypothetical protein
MSSISHKEFQYEKKVCKVEALEAEKKCNLLSIISSLNCVNRREEAPLAGELEPACVIASSE